MGINEAMVSAIVIVTVGLLLGVAIPSCVAKNHAAIVECVKAGRSPAECEQALRN